MSFLLTCLVGDGLGDERLSRSGGAVEENTAGGLDAKVLEERGVAKRELDHLTDLSKRRRERESGGEKRDRAREQLLEKIHKTEDTRWEAATPILRDTTSGFSNLVNKLSGPQRKYRTYRNVCGRQHISNKNKCRRIYLQVSTHIHLWSTLQKRTWAICLRQPPMSSYPTSSILSSSSRLIGSPSQWITVSGATMQYGAGSHSTTLNSTGCIA